MRTRVNTNVFFLFILGFLLPQSIRAEDVVYIKLGKPERCKVIEYNSGSPGYFQVLDSTGRYRSINIMNVEKIEFNVPPETKKTSAETATIEAVTTFPEKYLGQKMVFTGCVIGNKLERFKDGDYFLLCVTSKGGHYVVPSPSNDRIVFAIPKSMAEKMAPNLQGGYNWPNCTISCTVIKLDDNYLAILDRLDIYNHGGKIGSTYTAQ